MKNLSVLRMVSLGYILLIVIWLISRALFFDQFWLLALVNTVAEYLFVPLPFLLILNLWQRDKVSVLGLCIPLIAFASLFGHLFLPVGRPEATNQDNLLTVMSFNVLYSNDDHNAIVDSIKIANPDIVGIQELTPAIAQSLIEQLESDYPHHSLLYSGDGLSTSLMSRFPIESIERLDLPPRDLALRAAVLVNQQSIQVFVVHLSPNNFFDNPIHRLGSLAKERFGYRAGETALLNAMFRELDEPVLLLCDCNMTDTSEAYAHLDSALDDSFREVGWGLGHTLQPDVFSRSLPIQRIDYVWHSSDFEAIQAFVGQDGGSDHLPVVAVLRLNR